MSDYLPNESEIAAARPPLRDRHHTQLPPNDPAAEQGVLGCILLEPDASMDLCAEKLGRVGGEAFYDLRHGTLYLVIREMWEARLPVDIISVQSRLKERNQLEAIGGLAYLAGLQDTVPSAAHLGHYLEILLAKHALRVLLRFGQRVAIEAQEDSGDVAGLLAGVQTEALALTDSHIQVTVTSAHKTLPDIWAHLEKAQRGRQDITGIRTGLHYFDNMTSGLQFGEMFIVGARPSVGKTAYAVTTALRAVQDEVPTLVFSIEMSLRALMYRVLACGARVDMRTIRNGFTSEAAMKRLAVFQGTQAKWSKHLHIDSRSSLNGRDLYVTARRAKREHGVKLIIVDYLQLMEPVERIDNRVDQVAEISRWLKRTAKDLDVHVMALAQLNRQTATTRNARPGLADLRESGQIEQDADLVGLLHRPDLGREPDYEDIKWIQHVTPDMPKENSGWFGEKVRVDGRPGESFDYPKAWRDELDYIEMIVAKNRDGETGECAFVFQKRTTRFEDAFRPDYGQKAKQQQLMGEEV